MSTEQLSLRFQGAILDYLRTHDGAQLDVDNRYEMVLVEILDDVLGMDTYEYFRMINRAQLQSQE